MITCQYCNQPAHLVTGAKIYPHRPDLAYLNFWFCDNGHEPAYVGCHKGTDKPFGTLATNVLRKRRNATHKVFDRLWLDNDYTRKGAYKALAEYMQIPVKECHIGMFNIEQCEQVMEFVNDKSRHTPLRQPIDYENTSLRSDSHRLGSLREYGLDLLRGLKLRRKKA